MENRITTIDLIEKVLKNKQINMGSGIILFHSHVTLSRGRLSACPTG